jgi:DNA-binding IclR family transcriptional regulator
MAAADQGEGEGEGDARQGIQSVENAMTVLLALEQGLGPMSLTQIAAASAMAPSKAHRYLVSLARVGLVSQSRSSGLYDMGPSMRRLGAESLRRMDEGGLAAEYLPGLRDRTGHAVNLAVWGDHGPIIVRWDYGSYALPITVRVGATLPLLSSSVGRIFLAHLPAAMTDPVLVSQAETAADSGLTDADVEQLKAEARRDGFAVTAGGVLAGVSSIAAPVFAAADSLPVVVALVLPTRLAFGPAVADLAREVVATAAAMSADLGRGTPVPPRAAHRASRAAAVAGDLAAVGQLDQREEEVVDLPDRGDEVVEVDRLSHIRVGVQLVAAQDVLLGLRRGEHDDRDDRELRITLQLGQHLDAGKPGQVDVEQDQPRPRSISELTGPAHEVQRLLAVGHHVQRVADLVELEGLPGHEDVARVVLDQEHVDQRAAVGVSHRSPYLPRPRAQER